MAETNTECGGQSLRIMAWGAAAVVVVLYLGPAFIGVFRPPPDTYLDFVQEWLSARCFWAGEPVYLPQREAMLRRTGRDVDTLEERPWNAHPPVAVLVALPVGLIHDYRAAHLTWNLITFILFLVGIALILRELRVSVHWWSIFPAIVLLVADNPVISQLWHGQLNFPLFFLLSVAWILDRRGYCIGSGVAVGLATAIKLFPGLLLIYFLARRAWRESFVIILTVLAANALALALFGGDAFVTYIRDVLPSLEVFRGSWGNASFTGYWTRLCRAANVPGLARFVVAAFQVAAVVAIILVSWRATSSDRRDRAFMLAVAGMPLVSPIAWAYYFVLLALPLLLLWKRLVNTSGRIVLYAAIILLLVPEGLYPGLYKKFVPSSAEIAHLANHLPTPPDLGLCAFGLAAPTLALVAIFLLLAFAQFAPPVEANDAAS